MTNILDHDGYKAAFYEIADMLDIPARTVSAAQVWADEMRPRLLAALAPSNPVADEARAREVLARVCPGMGWSESEKQGIALAMLAFARETSANAAVPATNQAGEVATAVELLEQYAGFIRNDVKADDLERHPYLPLIEQTIAALATQPATSQEGEGVKPNRWYADAPKSIWLHGIGGGHETTWADDPSPTGDAEEEAHAVGYVRDDLAASPNAASAETGEREAIARIIDPDAWHDTLPADGCGEYWSIRRGKALAKADRILALTTAGHDVRALREALELSREQFAFYETSHRMKRTPEADAKADVNAGMVKMIDTALAQAGGKA